MKIIKNILISIITIILLIIIAFNIYNYVSIEVLKNDYATINGYTYFEVISDSMEPNISKGDLIIVDTKEQKYEKDDIVTFYDVNGAFVTHRIVAVLEDEVVTKGDANTSVDEAIPTDKIVGVYVFKLSGLAKLINSFRSPFVLVMILFIGILVCFLVSTDKDGKVILTDEEKEYMEFREYKKKNRKKSE